VTAVEAIEKKKKTTPSAIHRPPPPTGFASVVERRTLAGFGLLIDGQE
jgi:hypothetical protein